MSYINRYFAAIKHIAPSDMEYYLEEMASKGYILAPLSQSGLFCLKFTESRGEHVKYVVDVTGLQKHMYMKMLIDKGWEYMGQVLNCHIWKMSYDGSERPADFADQRCIRAHCIKMGIVFALVAVMLLLLFAGYIFLIYKEHAAAVPEKHDVLYGIMAALQIPFAAVFGILSARLFKEAGRRKANIERDMVFRTSRKAEEEYSEYTEEDTEEDI